MPTQVPNLRNPSPDGEHAGSLPDPHSYLRGLLHAALAATEADAGAVLLLYPDALDPEPDVWKSALGRDEGHLPHRHLDAWGAVVAERDGFARRPEVHHRANGDGAAAWLLPDSRTALCVPLADRTRPLGLLQVESRLGGSFADGQASRLTELADELVHEMPRLLLREQGLRDGSPVELVGASPAFRRLTAQLRQAARSGKAPVLLSGERGTGKELAARAIHGWGRRRRGPFVPVLVSALPETLAASELFGHERHVFTGAEERRIGRFEAAAGGTLFLDEVADIGPAVQSALLRVIENDEISRLGRDQPVAADARIVAATNRDLRAAARQGGFREDLLDRLSVLEIELPPLRHRLDDLQPLADHFLRGACEELQRRREMSHLERCRTCRRSGSDRCGTAAFYDALRGHDWPGNVRELRNLMLRLMATVHEAPLDAHHLPERYRGARPVAVGAPAADDDNLDRVVRRHIESVLAATGYNKSEAARRLGIPYTTLQSKLKKLGIARARHD